MTFVRKLINILCPTCADLHGEFVPNIHDDKCAVCRRPLGGGGRQG